MINSQQNHLEAFYDLYDHYAPALYGEICKNLYNKEICEQTLVDTYTQIWENISDYNPARERPFSWCFKFAMKEIRKQKINLLLTHIFACQSRSNYQKASV